MRASRTAPPLLLLVALATLLSGCGGATPGGPGEPSATATDTATPSPSDTDADGDDGADGGDDGDPGTTPPPAGDDPDDDTLSAAERATIRAAITSGDPAAIEPYLAEPVHLIYAATECCGPLSPADAIAGFDYAENAVPPWVDVPPADLATYRASFYGKWFPADLLAVRASDGFVISLGIEGGRITSIFMTWDDIIRSS